MDTLNDEEFYYDYIEAYGRGNCVVDNFWDDNEKKWLFSDEFYRLRSDPSKDGKAHVDFLKKYSHFFPQYINPKKRYKAFVTSEVQICDYYFRLSLILLSRSNP